MHPANRPTVRKIVVRRLFNLGNYEHESIELTVRPAGMELEDGSEFEGILENPEETLAEVRAALEACKPVEMPWDAQKGLELEKFPAVEGDPLSPEPEEAERYRQALAEYRAAELRRAESLRRLNKLGEVVVS